jgi:hypothetical protein
MITKRSSHCEALTETLSGFLEREHWPEFEHPACMYHGISARIYHLLIQIVAIKHLIHHTGSTI